MSAPLELIAAARAELDPIFAVDDEEHDRQLFLRALAAAGIENPCRQFTCGCEMLDALIDVLRGDRAPVACFVDVKMARMTGLDVLRWIRAQQALHEVPVVMLSSSEASDHIAEAMLHGAQCYTAKFPAPDQLREIFANAKRFTAAACGSSTFPVACNLLFDSSRAVA
jgi:two-component system, response regulator